MKFLHKVLAMFGQCFGIIPGVLEGVKQKQLVFLAKKLKNGPKWWRIPSQYFSEHQKNHMNFLGWFYVFKSVYIFLICPLYTLDVFKEIQLHQRDPQFLIPKFLNPLVGCNLCCRILTLLSLTMSLSLNSVLTVIRRDGRCDGRRDGRRGGLQDSK